MCGSTDLLKQDGVFVCQSCGTKYSIEEAKKMMVEGVVNVQGTVKIDDSNKLNSLYTLARRAKNEDNSEDATKYYDQISIEDPQSWEAQFYKVYFSCKQTKIANMGSSCVKLANTIENVFKLIDYTVDNDNEKEKAYEEVFQMSISYSQLIENNIAQRGNSYSDPSRALDFMGEHLNGVVVLLVKVGDACKNVGLTSNALFAYKESEVGFRFIDVNTKNSIIERIKAIDPSYTYQKSASSGGCYIATAVYGSYDCPQVWTLRRYRDYTLAETWYGRAFIHTYYAISPTLVKWFGHTDWFKKIWKGKLDSMVANLNAKGIEDTPYEDRK
jgi:tetratricopeptide (TPR) repeat protein